MLARVIALATLPAAFATTVLAEGSLGAADREVGKQRFEQYCLACHTGVVPEAPNVEGLKQYPPERIVSAMTSGVMSTAALPLSEQEILQVSYYLTGKTIEVSQYDETQYYCSDEAKPDEAAATSASWTGWGGPAGSQRYQAAEQILSPANVDQLSLKWAFAFPQTTRMRAQPTVTADTVYIGSQVGKVYALDAASGCIRWSFDAGNEVRGAVNLQVDAKTGKRTLFFGDFKANAYAVNANTGELLWRTSVHDHDMATITGSVIAGDKLLYVPVSSSEVVPAGQEEYPCCTFRGALVALDLTNGNIAWRTYTTEEPRLTGKNSAGANQYGPSGAPIWSGPTLDRERNLVIATTGQNYSSPATGTSDAVIAMDADTGAVRWVSQVTANDAWNGACARKTANCPEEDGPDFDIGASAILTTTASGKQLVLAGQKSGIAYGMDPNADGKILWRTRVGSGGTMGGVHWGMSSDGEQLYVGISDLPTRNPYAEGPAMPGVHALDPENGEILWRKLLPPDCPEKPDFACFPGVSAAVSSSPGLVFAGTMDGRLRAFDARDGKILWSYQTRQPFDTVNGVEGNGGSIEADGPVIANGQLYITSGYDKWTEKQGNVLLVFGLPQN